MKVFEPRNKGFTLIELVMVIILLGITAVGTSNYMQFAAESYVDVARRDKLHQMGRIAVERITRELRHALPGSVRVNSDTGVQCLEFVPIVTATTYLEDLASKAKEDFQVLDFELPPTPYDDYYAAVYTIKSSLVYDTSGSNRSRVGINDITNPTAPDPPLSATDEQMTIHLDKPPAPLKFKRESPRKRLYIVKQPVSFCAENGLLTRYQGEGSDYTYQSNQASVTPPHINTGTLLAEHIRLVDADSNAIDVFTFDSGTLRRTGVIALDFQFQDADASDEWVQFSHEVLLRNLP